LIIKLLGTKRTKVDRFYIDIEKSSVAGWSTPLYVAFSLSGFLAKCRNSTTTTCRLGKCSSLWNVESKNSSIALFVQTEQRPVF
jgi:hypothetical protein